MRDTSVNSRFVCARLRKSLLNVSIRQLRAFVAVTRLGSFARAAEELNAALADRALPRLTSRDPAVHVQVADLDVGKALRRGVPGRG